MSNNGWIAVDLDGTLAHYDGWKGIDHIGEPVKLMLNHVTDWLAKGQEVRIFTARVYAPRYEDIVQLKSDEFDKALDRVKEARLAKQYIQEWCLKHIGVVLEVTCVKDFAMIELWDDRAVRVGLNTGERVL